MDPYEKIGMLSERLNLPESEPTKAILPAQPTPERRMIRCIYNDARQHYCATGHLPRFAYIVSKLDWDAIAGDHCARHKSGSRYAMHLELHVSGGVVHVLGDLLMQRNEMVRQFLCKCGALFSDDSSRSGMCEECIRSEVQRMASELSAEMTPDARARAGMCLQKGCGGSLKPECDGYRQCTRCRFRWFAGVVEEAARESRSEPSKPGEPVHGCTKCGMEFAYHGQAAEHRCLRTPGTISGTFADGPTNKVIRVSHQHDGIETPVGTLGKLCGARVPDPDDQWYPGARDLSCKLPPHGRDQDHKDGAFGWSDPPRPDGFSQSRIDEIKAMMLATKRGGR